MPNEHTPHPGRYHVQAGRIEIEKHLTPEELERRIKTEEKDAKMLNRFYFVHYRYEGRRVKETAELVGTTKCTSCIWPELWNESEYERPQLRFGGKGGGGGAPRSRGSRRKIRPRH